MLPPFEIDLMKHASIAAVVPSAYEREAARALGKAGPTLVGKLAKSAFAKVAGQWNSKMILSWR